jgi:hypothetical protein
MKIAVVSESSTDEAAVKILVDAIVGHETELFSLRARPNGWPHVLNLLPNIIIGLHYGTDVEALVVVVDSDESPIHRSAHETPEAQNPDCRLCLLRNTVRGKLAQLHAVPNRITMKSGLGLAVPAIEAWYCCGLDPHVTEFEWARKLQGERLTYDKRSLKASAYGSDPSSNFDRTDVAKQAAHRLAADLELLRQRFPNGFGVLMRDIRDW